MKVNIAFNISSSTKEILKKSSSEYNWTNRNCFSQSRSSGSELMDSLPVPADICQMKNLSFERDTCLSLSNWSRLFSLSCSLLAWLGTYREFVICIIPTDSYICFSLFISSFNYWYSWNRLLFSIKELN